MRWGLGLIGIAGASLLFGDGLITPAISVLSAIEGLEVSVPQAKPFVLPISAASCSLSPQNLKATSRNSRAFLVSYTWAGSHCVGEPIASRN